MSFRQRWGFIVILILTVICVFYIPLGKIEKCHGSCKNCVSTKHEPGKARQTLAHDWVLNNSKARSASHRNRNYGGSQHLTRPTFQQDGWILDCITWEKKWETPSPEVEPREFIIEAKLAKGEDSNKRKHTFTEIFRKRDWPANDASYFGMKASGPGAMLKHSQGVMAALHVIIVKLKDHLRKSRISILDVPCGDLQWMSKFLLTRNDVDYTGMDIVPDIIKHHQKEFTNLPHVKFVQKDIVRSPLNETFDLVLCRDLLQHLWKSDALKALKHISESGSEFIVATTFPDTSQNMDVEKDALGSRKYPYNLELPPFMLVPPVCSSYDWNVEHLGLWSLPLKQKYDL